MVRKNGEVLEKEKQKEQEQEIASEALELVKHGLSLLESQFYDDSIEILRQAIGLYAQINRVSEIEALNGKISEIYLVSDEYRKVYLWNGVNSNVRSKFIGAKRSQDIRGQVGIQKTFELEELLKEAEEKQKELDYIRKNEKKKQRVEVRRKRNEELG